MITTNNYLISNISGPKNYHQSTKIATQTILQLFKYIYRTLSQNFSRRYISTIAISTITIN